MKKERIHDTMELQERIENLTKTIKVRKSVLDKIIKVLKGKESKKDKDSHFLNLKSKQ